MFGSTPNADTASTGTPGDIATRFAAATQCEADAAEREERRRERWGFGLSFLLHFVAIIVLGLMVTPVATVVPFLKITLQPEQDDEFVKFDLVEMPEPPIEVVHHLDRPVEAVVIPAGSENDPLLEGAQDALDDAFLPASPVPIDNIAAEIADTGSLLATIGGGAEGDGPDADGLGATIGFYGVKASGRRFVFVTDCSSSMGGYMFQRLKEELRSSINGLPQKAEFFIVFFNGGALPMPAEEMVRATPKHKRTYLDWSDQVPSDGGTDPSAAMEIALGLKPSVVFLLTDGAFSPEPTFAVIARLNEQRKTQIHTIAIGQRAAEQVLQRIAKENKGTYRFVPHQ